MRDSGKGKKVGRPVRGPAAFSFAAPLRAYSRPGQHKGGIGAEEYRQKAACRTNVKFLTRILRLCGNSKDKLIY